MIIHECDIYAIGEFLSECSYKSRSDIYIYLSTVDSLFIIHKSCTIAYNYFLH